MALTNGLGVNPPPNPSPLARLIDRQPQITEGRIDPERYEVDVEVPWFLFFAALYRAVQSGGGGGSTFPTTPYTVVTPADNITPALELISWDGTLAITLDRALTTIQPATLNGITPYNGFKFQIIFTNDASDGRDVAFNAAYLNCAPVSGVASAREIYHFTVQGGEFLCDYQAQSIL